MSKFSILVLSLLVITPSFTSAGEADFLKNLKLEKYSKKSLKNLDVKAFSAFIFTVLSNTQELHIHQMNGEIYNEVYIHDEGHEAVFRFDHDEKGKKIDGTGKLVTDCLNQGSFNYYHPYKAPLGHFAFDILPWLMWGNCKEDPSTLNQRIEAYMLDFRAGHALALDRKEGFYLPKRFGYKDTGQSETVGFFAKALENSGFDFKTYFPGEFSSPEKQEEFFKALEAGIKELLKNT